MHLFLKPMDGVLSVGDDTGMQLPMQLPVNTRQTSMDWNGHCLLILFCDIVIE